MRAIFLILLLLPAGAGALTLEEAIETALKNDPRLVALQEEAAAAAIARRAAGRLLGNNPTLGLEGDIADGEPIKWSVAIEQPLELGGQQGARRAAADAARKRAEAGLLVRRRDVAAEVRAAFVRALAAKERQAIAAMALELAQQAADGAEQRYEAGKISRLARNGTRVEQGRAARELAEAAVRRVQASLALRVLLGLAPDAPVEPEGRLARQAQDGHVTPAALLAELGLHEVAAARLAREESSALRELASASAFPGVSIGASYLNEFNKRTVGLLLFLELPFFERNEAERARAHAELARATAEQIEVERRSTGMLHQAGARLDAAGLAVAAFEAQTLEALEENLSLATSAFRAGDIDYLTYQQVRRDALEGKRAWIDALEELALAQAAYDRFAPDGAR